MKTIKLEISIKIIFIIPFTFHSLQGQKHHLTIRSWNQGTNLETQANTREKTFLVIFLLNVSCADFLNESNLKFEKTHQLLLI